LRHPFEVYGRLFDVTSASIVPETEARNVRPLVTSGDGEIGQTIAESFAVFGDMVHVAKGRIKQ
jgi:hypothetical protein